MRLKAHQVYDVVRTAFAWHQAFITSSFVREVHHPMEGRHQRQASWWTQRLVMDGTEIGGHVCMESLCSPQTNELGCKTTARTMPGKARYACLPLSGCCVGAPLAYATGHKRGADGGSCLICTTAIPSREAVLSRAACLLT